MELSTREREVHLSALAEKRITTVRYIKKAHEGCVHWMNVMELSLNELKKHYATDKKLPKRCEQWFTLGYGLGSVLQIPSEKHFVRAVTQLFFEFRYHFFSTHTNQVYISAWNSFTSFQMITDDDEYDAFKPRINKGVTTVVYEYLSTVHLPFQMDYFQVLYNFCDVLCDLYSRFSKPACAATLPMFEYILKADRFLMDNCIGVVLKEVHKVALSLVSKQTQSLSTLFSLAESQEEEEASTEGARAEKMRRMTVV